ncbi:UDP-N-acetylmuramoyl-L-alanyl-D-glutamate--2, 6-diaminopimelate ligase [Triticum urartu]|uniref:UDP-N-acetylmuramoyl-L-alanyl-D-glutamate--2,6-diaminopimelate ligase MurE homolog, chloroplastic n=2 Tax=Triticum urartu TaxID=4572 RepID=M7ZEJ1_TRIUA|nr:UDP-N-acetylmuramoyl-L-alanyl-D-glutamate--2, 6-diaminopimelate ligase [Triticum urartu]
MAGSHNDTNVLQRSQVFARLAEGNSPPVNVTINNHNYDKGYYLGDGIYSQWTNIVKTIPNPVGEKKKRFAEEQESARKDVELVFGVLQSRRGIVRYPARTWSTKKLWEMMTACVIMHNMIVEYERPERIYDQGFHFQESGLAGLTEADKRGAVAVVADQDVDIEGTLACRALVIVDDITAALRVLPACLYRRPSKDMAVIGITGTDGVTTTSHLVKAMYEAMGVRTGMVGVLGAYAFGSNKLDAQPAASGDSMAVQKLMATMLHNGAEAVVLETTTDEMLPSGVDSEIDYDIAVLTNVRHANLEASMTYEGYMSSMASLFSRMVDPERHRKVVNIDDPSAPFFAAQGGHGVPVVTYSFENKKADVHTLKYQLSLFETEVLVQTPHGILEISSGLLGRDNIYNILATVAVGVAVGAPLEDIVKGIEEVDAIPGRCELIDEEQAFGVIIDHARTPEALSRLLDSVKELGPRRIVTVVGCCGEKERGKRPMMTKIAAEKSDVVMLTSDNPARWTMEEYLKHGANDYYPPLPNGHRLFLHDIRRVAVRAAVAMGEQGDVVVVTGKGNDTYQMEGDKKEFFDDREECREALQYVDQLHRSGIDTSEFPWRILLAHQTLGGRVHQTNHQEENAGASMEAKASSSSRSLSSVHLQLPYIELPPKHGGTVQPYEAVYIKSTDRDSGYYGVSATLDVYGYNLKDGQVSGAAISISNFEADFSKNVSAITVGWVVWPSYFNDSQTYLYTAWTKDSRQSTGCVNYDCPGIQLVSGSPIFPGDVIAPVSQANGTRQTITIKLFRTKLNGNWWLHAGVNDEDPIPVAYFPASLFDDFFYKATQVVLGGHALKSKTTTPPPMGSGAFGSDWGNAAKIRDIHVIMEDGRSNFIDDDLSTDAHGVGWS